MGRLLRKKPFDKKKKKKEGSNGAIPAAPNVRPGVASALVISETARDVKNKTVTTQQKTSFIPRALWANQNNILGKSLQFLREVKIELKKVAWPSRKQTIGSTVVVIILVLILSFFLGIVDLGLSGLVRVVLQ